MASLELYRQRQQIVKHPYGTLKRQWGFDHVLTKKTQKRASADPEKVETSCGPDDAGLQLAETAEHFRNRWVEGATEGACSPVVS